MKRSILFLATLVSLYSCSPTQQISRSAKKGILQSEPLQAAHIGISIFDPAANKYLYNYQGDKYFVPASNTKIPTCYAAMKYLGDSLVGIRYQVQNDSFIKIRSTGDPSFLHQDFNKQPVFDFLTKYKYIAFTGDLFSEDFLGNGWAWNNFKEDYSAQRSDFPIYGNTVTLRWIHEDSVLLSPNLFGLSIMESLTNGFELIKSWEENV